MNQAATDNWGMAGHSWAVSMLRQQLMRGTTRHAYLITGPRGIGRRTLALRFAQALICESSPEPGIPCGSCDNCRRVVEHKHPDVSVIEATAEGAVLKVDQVRELRRIISLKPFQSRYRVALLNRFQEANDAAANALLKTLEEAPAYAILILTAESPEALRSTIVSRCELLRLQPVPVDQMQQMLRSRGADPARARLLAHISAGSPGIAVRMFEQPGLLEDRARNLADLRFLLGATGTKRLAYAASLSSDRAAMRGILMTWLSFWRDVLWHAGSAEVTLVNLDCVEQIDDLSQHLGLVRAARQVANLDRALRRLDSNVNARLLAEVLLLDWPRHSPLEVGR